MKPKDTIYQSGKSGSHGELVLMLPRIIRLFFHLLRGAGAGLIAFAVLLFMFSYGPIISQELSYNFRDQSNSTMGKSDTDSNYVRDYSADIVEAEEILNVQKEAGDFGVTSYFSVVIPKIDAKANVIANVDPSDREEYLDALSKGIAHAKGTNFPGQNGRIFMFSHSTDSPVNFTRFNAIFYLLKKLEKGDSIIVFFADKKYEYEVSETKITTPDDTSWLEPKLGEEELVLMTCDPPGTTWNRLMIVAKPVSK